MPVWRSRCPRARFTILVSCNLQFNHVHSFFYRGRLRNWQAYCFVIGLYCVTIRWQQIFKGSLQIMVKGVSRHVTVERSHLVYSGIARNFILCEKKHEWICSNASTSLKNPVLVWDFKCEQCSWTEWIASSYFYGRGGSGQKGWGGDFSNIWQPSLITVSTSQHCVTKQWTTRWPNIANVALRIVQNYDEYSYFLHF